MNAFMSKFEGGGYKKKKLNEFMKESPSVCDLEPVFFLLRSLQKVVYTNSALSNRGGNKNNNSQVGKYFVNCEKAVESVDQVTKWVNSLIEV